MFFVSFVLCFHYSFVCNFMLLLVADVCAQFRRRSFPVVVVVDVVFIGCVEDTDAGDVAEWKQIEENRHESFMFWIRPTKQPFIRSKKKTLFLYIQQYGKFSNVVNQNKCHLIFQLVCARIRNIAIICVVLLFLFWHRYFLLLWLSCSVLRCSCACTNFVLSAISMTNEIANRNINTLNWGSCFAILYNVCTSAVVATIIEFDCLDMPSSVQ